MKKMMIGYSIWCKRDMLSWLLEGIVNSFDPAHVEVAFHFDACDDGSHGAYNSMRDYWLVNRGFKDHVLSSSTETREVGGHNALLKVFMASSCELLCVAQDDQRFTSREHHGSLEKLSEAAGTSLGVIGGRDGYHKGYTQFAGSTWSESAGIAERIPLGEWRERPYVNSGPIVYNRNLVEKVGFLDENFYAYYVWDDYCARALKTGLRNFVAGTSVTHAKFGCMKNTWWAVTGDHAAHDSALLQQKHG